jgi:peptide deformylase
MQLKVVTFPNPVLRKKAKAVKRVTPEIVKLMEDMLETMRAAPGVGLAAPQVGVLLRVIVAEFAPPGEPAVTLELANPKILKKHGRQTFMEGCLSLPGVEAPVERAKKVVVQGLDKRGKLAVVEAEGLLGTILQHEMDHLDGLVFIDRVEDPALIKHVTFEREKKEELI